MMNKKIYVLSATQISMQKPLSEEWMSCPIAYSEPFVRSINPSFNGYVSPNEMRRIGVVLKRAIATSTEALKQSGLPTVDAIFTGTGYGCIENSELFLDVMCREGEDLQKPTCFMQSTHNTISSMVAIQTKNHGYNVTYSHKGVSFDSALLDAWTQFRLNMIRSALVGGFDEMTPSFFQILKRGGVFDEGTILCGEAAVSIVLGDNDEGHRALCMLTGFKMLYRPSLETMKDAVRQLLENAGKRMSDVDAVLTGMNGCEDTDNANLSEAKAMFGDRPLLKYKHIFGESMTSSGLGFYAAASCLKSGFIPSAMFVDDADISGSKPHCIILYNRSDGNNYSITLIESCGDY